MRFSRVSGRNENVVDLTDEYEKRGNLEFFAGALGRLAEQGLGCRGVGVIGLLGQKDFPGVALRAAQSVLRWDLRPGLWSHAFLIAAPADPASRELATVPIWEVAFTPRRGDFPPPELNAVTEGRLGDCNDASLHANAALLAYRMRDEDARKVIERARRPNVDRLRYNLWEMLGVWQAYVWARGKRPNPLDEGIPIFSSSYVEMAYEAIGLDLSPGASERNSAPEHIWNGALWWHEAYRAKDHPVSGFCVLRNRQCFLQDAGPSQLTDHLAAGPRAARPAMRPRARGSRRS